MLKIKIKPSTTADTRSCDYAAVTLETLKKSTLQHKDDVKKAMLMFSDMIFNAAENHDNHKLATLEHFHATFVSGFKDDAWWNEHRKERHHLPEDLEDINMIDIIEHISDCVVAGKARTGKIFPLKISDAVLRKAFENTVELLVAAVEVV